VKDGVRNGGLAVNHAPVTALLKDNNNVVGVTFRDDLVGETYAARARAVVNATGVWVDSIRKLDRPGVANLMRLSKGTHLVLTEGEDGCQHIKVVGVLRKNQKYIQIYKVIEVLK